MLKVLPNIIAISFLALSPKELPEKAEPIEEERGGALVGNIWVREIIWDLDLVTILPVGHHSIGVHAIDIAITPISGTRLGIVVGVEFDVFILQESAGAVMVPTLQKVIIDIGVEVVDHDFGVVHSAVVTRSRGSVVDHRNSTHRASSPGVHPDIHLVHGGERWDCSHPCRLYREIFKSDVRSFRRATSVSGDQA